MAEKDGCCFSLDTLGYFPIYGYFIKDGFTFIENTVHQNGRREKFPAESQHFFKHEKEERRSFLILINEFKVMNSIWFVSTAKKL